jgi:hypothetical protein
MMKLNPPTLVEHNNDSAMNGIILKYSPPKSSNQHFDIKKYNRLYKRRLRHQVVSQMVSRNHVLYAIDIYVTSCG